MHGSRNIFFNVALILIVLLFLIPTCAMAESGFVVFDPVDIEKTLPGSAFYLSCGPGAKVEVPLKMDGMEASGTWTVSRLLRVTLFEADGMSSMWVDPLTFELEDQAQWVDGEISNLMTEPRRVRFTYVEDGAFLVSKGAEW